MQDNPSSVIETEKNEFLKLRSKNTKNLFFFFWFQSVLDWVNYFSTSRIT